MSASEAKKATSRSGNYQESATDTLLGGELDTDEAAGIVGDVDEQEALCLSEDIGGSILAGVDKVSTVISQFSPLYLLTSKYTMSLLAS